MRYNQVMGFGRNRIFAAMTAGLLLASSVFAAAAPAAGPPQGARQGLQDLRSLGQLREGFNRDAGKIRLILLLSPT